MDIPAIFESIKFLFLPPGLSLLLGMLGLILWRWHKLSRFFLALAILFLVLSAIPGVGLWLQERLANRVPLVASEAKTDTNPYPVVVFTGGIYRDGQGGWWPGQATVERVAAGFAYAQAHRVPLIVAGGSPRQGVPLEATVTLGRMQVAGDQTDLIVSPAGGTTYESAAPVAEKLKSRNIERVVVATDTAHSLRTSAVLRNQGIEVQGRIEVGPEPETEGVARWLPSLHGLLTTRRAVYEFVALAWYLLRGYLDWSDLAPNGAGP